MNMNELKEWKENKRKENAIKWNLMKNEDGSCEGLTKDEYNKMYVKQKTSRTHRSHSKGNLWNHYNERITKDTVVNYKVTKWIQ